MKAGNPMRWDCEARGCFNLLKRPKIEVFAECFPRGINFGDVDGIVEIGGRFLLLEFKPAPIDFSRGQRLLYERITSSPNGAIQVLGLAGDAETMEITHLCRFRRGAFRAWATGDLNDAKAYVIEWSKRASR